MSRRQREDGAGMTRSTRRDLDRDRRRDHPEGDSNPKLAEDSPVLFSYFGTLQFSSIRSSPYEVGTGGTVARIVVRVGVVGVSSNTVVNLYANNSILTSLTLPPGTARAESTDLFQLATGTVLESEVVTIDTTIARLTLQVYIKRRA